MLTNDEARVSRQSQCATRDLAEQVREQIIHLAGFDVGHRRCQQIHPQTGRHVQPWTMARLGGLRVVGTRWHNM